MTINELIAQYPYKERLPTIMALMDVHSTALKNGYNRLIDQARARGHSKIVMFEAWALAACDKAIEEADKNTTSPGDELLKVIRESGTN